VSSYRIHSDPDQLRVEIMKHGPIEVDFLVYSDFLSYKSGESMDLECFNLAPLCRLNLLLAEQ